MLPFLSLKIEQTSLLTGKPVELVRSRCTRAHWGPSRANKAEKILSQDLFCRNDRATLVTLGASARWLLMKSQDDEHSATAVPPPLLAHVSGLLQRGLHSRGSCYMPSSLRPQSGIAPTHISKYVIVSRGNLSSASRKARHKLGSVVTCTHINGYRNNLHPP